MSSVNYIPDTWVVHKSNYCPKNNSRTGYGSKIPTEYTVFDGKLTRRIYAICYSNVASHYIIKEKQHLFIPGYMFP